MRGRAAWVHARCWKSVRAKCRLSWSTDRSSADWSTRKCWRVPNTSTAAVSVPITRPRGSNCRNISANAEQLERPSAGAAPPLTNRRQAEILVVFLEEEKVPRAEQRYTKSGTAETAQRAVDHLCCRRLDCGYAGTRRHWLRANRLRSPWRRLHQRGRRQWRSDGLRRPLRA